MGYGFKHGVSGGTGKALGSLVVTAPVGVTAIISKDDKSYTKTVGSDGIATFKGLTTGKWKVVINNNSQTSTQYVTLTLDYSIVMAFFASTISVTYPAGATCTCSDGKTTLTAPNTTGKYTFTVPNTGSWTVNITDGINTASETVNITEDKQSKSVTLAFFAATISVKYPSGSTCTCSDGSTTLTALDTSGSYIFTVRRTGSWTIKSTNGEKSASKVVSITSDGQSASVELFYATYLCNKGDQCTSVTGGYTAVAKKAASSASHTGAPAIIDNASSMTIQPQKTSSPGQYVGGIVKTTNKIDCKNYSKLVFKGAVSGVVDGFNSAAISIWTEIGSDNQTENRVKHQKLYNDSTTVTVDISDLTSSYYIGFGFDSQNSQIEVNVSELYLE
jgi:hypothetical protein